MNRCMFRKPCNCCPCGHCDCYFEGGVCHGCGEDRARHDYRGVSADLEAWYPKLKVGGLFAGDDYGPNPETLVDFGHGRVSFGVKRAVDEFALAHAKNVSIDWLAQWSVKDADGSEQMARNWWLIR